MSNTIWQGLGFNISKISQLLWNNHGFYHQSYKLSLFTIQFPSKVKRPKNKEISSKISLVELSKSFFVFFFKFFHLPVFVFGSCIQLANLFIGLIPYKPSSVSCTVKCVIMHKDRTAVTGNFNIKFNSICTIFLGLHNKIS